MNLTVAENLVRRITGFLNQPEDDAQAARLAQEYAELCRIAQRRLEQCAVMLAQGELHQAMQLAEAPPPVLDLVTILAFRQAREWRTFCLARGLPAADPFPEKAVRQLNAAYEQAPSRPHPLYRDYRRAIQRNDDFAALHALRRILAENPNDTNARREIPRLERKILQQELARLDELMQSGDESAAVALAERIESAGLEAQAEGDAWRAVQTLRARAALTQLQSLRAEDSWEEARSLLTRLEEIRGRQALDWKPDELAALQQTRAWVERRAQAAADDSAHREVLAEMDRLLEDAEASRMAVRPPRLAELRRRHEALLRKYHDIERVGRALPEQHAHRFEQVRQFLQWQIERRLRLSRMLAYSATALVLLLGFLAVLRVQSVRRARALAAELETLVASREIVAVENLVTGIRAREARRAEVPVLKAALGRADAFLQRERNQEKALLEAIDHWETLAQGGFSAASPETIEELRGRIAVLHSSLPPDLQAAATPKIHDLQNRWATHLDRIRVQRHRELARDLENAEGIVRTELRFEEGPESVRTALRKLQPVLDRLVDAARTPVEALKPSSTLASRIAALEQRASTFTKEIADWDRYEPLLQKPASFEEHLRLLQWLTQSEFASSTRSRAAGEALAGDLTVTNLALGLLLPGWEDATAASFGQAEPPFIPATVLPAERAKYAQLRDDEWIHDLRVCLLRERRSVSEEFPEGRRVWSLGPLSTNRFGTREGKVYDPVLSPNALSFEPREFRSYRWSIEEIGRSPEHLTWERSGMSVLIDSNTGAYGISGLECLDRINAETNASSVFRAYLTLQLHELMALRPWEWGLAWAPAAVADHRRLLELGAGAIRRGDWLVPTVLREREQALKGFFENARKVSYADQGRVFHKLVTRAWEQGFGFAGYAGLDGQPILADPNLNAEELWGWRRDTRKPGLIGTRSASGGRWSMAPAALPLGPLFAFRGDRHALLRSAAAEASLSATSPVLSRHLPPLFASPP